MPRFDISSIDDDHVRAYRDLPRKAARRSTTTFVVEGRWLVQRLMQSEIEVASILCLTQHAEEFAELAGDIPLLVADRSLLEQIVGFEFHRGVLACGKRPPAVTLNSIAISATKKSLLAVCSGVRDQENLGGVIRNCRALGVDALLLDAHCADPFSRRVMRVSAGAALSLPIVESTHLQSDLLWLRDDRDFQLVATVLDESAMGIEHLPASARMVVLFGSEGYGLDEAWRAISNVQVTLPMQGGVDSLNIAVASGIFLHHCSRLQNCLDITANS